MQKLQANIEKEQEMLSNLADLMIEIYAMESVLLRTKKLIARQGEDKAKNAIQMTEVYLHEAFAKIEAIAKQCLVMVEEGDMLRTGLSMVKRLTRTSPINTISLKREIAQRVIQAEKYVV